MKFIQFFCGEKIVLDALASGEKLFPLEIVDQINQNRKITISLGWVYRILNRLEDKGLVGWEWCEPQEASSFRQKYYKLVNPHSDGNFRKRFCLFCSKTSN